MSLISIVNHLITKTII